MKILCDIVPWEEKLAERGVSTGEKQKYRIVLGCDPFNWFVGVQYVDETKPLLYKKYYSCIKIALVDTLKITNDKIIAAFANRLIGVLVEKTGLQPQLTIDNPFDMDNLEELGQWIDDEFKLSFGKEYPPDVYLRLFGSKNNLQPQDDKNDDELTLSS